LNANRNSIGTASHRFQALVMPHVDAAYNLARWLLHDVSSAEDVVQESCLRAYRAMGTFSEGDARAWLLKIVRNTCFTWMRKNGRYAEPADGELEDIPDTGDQPDADLLRSATVASVRAAIAKLPPEFRELIVLREMEGLSYKELAEMTGVPVGTVMSRLSRARQRLAHDLTRLGYGQTA
jgi:RNA polymerase sigma-70 factor (ECF subfamily)